MLVFAALFVPTQTATASYSMICQGYSSCSSKGYSHGGYESHKGTSYWRMYTGTNCTNYVAYRLVTTNGMPNTRPKAGVGNARDWGTTMSSITNSTPTVGSVAWWGRTGNHVAYVEKVVSSSEIWVSESNWGGPFDWRKITKSGSGWPDGFIHFADQRFSNSAKPRIRETVRVGGPLTVWVGEWSPKSGNTYSYRWRVDGKAISGATAKTYTPSPSQLGKKVSVSVTVNRPAYPSATSTSAASEIGAGRLTRTQAPSITGTPRIDSTLSASPGTFSPAGTSYGYRWLVDGSEVPGATGTTFTPGPEHVDRKVTVEVTARRPGYAELTATSAPTAGLAPGPLAPTARPTISGTPKVGTPLTASAGAWSKSGTTHAYQWYVDGTAVGGATGSTFVPRPADLDRTVTVHVTASRRGYADATAISTKTRAIAPGTLRSTAAPGITGSTRVGSTLTASPGTWSPSGAYTYEWFANGERVAGATARTFTPTTHQHGARLRVRVTAHADGYVSAWSLSPNTAAIGNGSIRVTAPPSITGSPRLGSSVSVAPGTHTPAGATLRYQWLRDGVVLSGVTGRTHRIGTGDLGHRLSARVTLSASRYTSRTVTTATSAPAKATSTLHVAATPGPSKLSFSVKVSASGVAAPDGTLHVRNADGAVRTVKVVDGTARWAVPTPAAGTHAYVVEFTGTPIVAPSTATKTITIG